MPTIVIVPSTSGGEHAIGRPRGYDRAAHGDWGQDRTKVPPIPPLDGANGHQELGLKL